MEAVIPYIEHSRIESRCDEIVRALTIASDYNIIFIEEGSRRFADALVSRIGHGATTEPLFVTRLSFMYFGMVTCSGWGYGKIGTSPSTGNVNV